MKPTELLKGQNLALVHITLDGTFPHHSFAYQRIFIAWLPKKKHISSLQETSKHGSTGGQDGWI